MNIVDIASLVFSVTVGDCKDCDASAFHAVTAAWATKGYWMQAEIIHFLGGTGLGIYASLLYIIAVGAGLIGYMLGNPPRNYLWYLFGPALFNILVFTTVESGGVNWQVGLFADGSPDLGDQAEVWKEAEVGLLNMSIKDRLGMTITRDHSPTGGPFDGKVEVAHLFVWLDMLISDFVQGTIGLLGANFLSNNTGSTNINNITGSVTVPTTQFQEMSGMKWQLLQNITAASIKSPVMAKALGVFLGSECGDILSAEIDQSNFTAAARSKTGEVPETVFINHNGVGSTQDYAVLQQKFDGMWIAMPQPLKDLYKDTEVPKGTGNSLNHFSALSEEATNKVAQEDSISCTNFLNYLVESMRWEAGNAYMQLIDQAPSQVPEEGVAFALFYGWGLRDENGVLLPASELDSFTMNLMLVHIVKNLFEYTPVSPDQRYSPSEEVESYIQLQQKTTSSTTKFAEVYSWALMIPYIQGLTMYFLALAYPIVCIAMIMPAAQDAADLDEVLDLDQNLDLGFALVQAIERSVWAMMSNSDRTQKALERVDAMNQYSDVITFNCTQPNPDPLIPAGRNCLVPNTVEDALPAANAFSDTIMPVFDRALALSVNLQLDLANSYYIYIMAALYFAVPALAGQLVGGAGNIASGALDKMTDVKAAAGAGYTSDMNQRMAGFAQSYGQESSFKGQRSDGKAIDGKGGAGFGARAIQQANAGWSQGQMAGEYDATNQAIGTGQQLTQQAQSHASAAITGANGRVNALASGINNVGTGLDRAFQPAGGAAPGAAIPGGGAGAIPGGGAGAVPGGANPAGAGGAGGNSAGALQQLMGAAANHANKIGGFGFAGGAAAKATWDIGVADKQQDLAQGTADTMAAAEAAKGVNSAGSAVARMQQGRLQADAGRLSRAGSFAGSESKWNAMNDLNTKMGGRLGVIGLNFSPYGAGGRSDDAEGGSYAGRMNYADGAGKIADMTSQGNFYGNGNPSGAENRINGFSGQLNGEVNRALGNYTTHKPDHSILPDVSMKSFSPKGGDVPAAVAGANNPANALKPVDTSIKMK